jgi:hypothetical protein
MVPGPILYRKWGLAPFILKASLSSPPERNLARSAFLTVFHHTAIAKQGNRRRRASRGSGLIIGNAIRARARKISFPDGKA